MTNYCAKCGRPLGTGDNNGICLECHNSYQLNRTPNDETLDAMMEAERAIGAAEERKDLLPLIKEAEHLLSLAEMANLSPRLYRQIERWHEKASNKLEWIEADNKTKVE